MSKEIIITEIERLAQICRKEETNLLLGKYELCLNESVIHFITNDFKFNTINNSFDIKVNYLKKLFAKTPSIKIIGDKRTVSSQESVVYLNQFVSCVCLQLIRISFKRLVGFETIRSQLKSLNCLKCFDTQVLDEDFWSVFGVWPLLASLKLSQNNIISLNASIIPSSVKILDLSWNRIQVFDSIANYSVNSISKLDLSYNCLTFVPKLNHFSCLSLKSLFIRGNLIEDIKGVECLTNIVELDLGINCIIDFNSIILCLKGCKSLKCLWIEGNPFDCDPNIVSKIEKELTFLIQLNGNNIIRNDFIGGSSADKHENLNERQVLISKSDEENELFFEASNESMDSINKSSVKNGLNKKKNLRVVKIKEQTDINQRFEELDIKSNDTNDRKCDNSSEAKELIQKRKELGEEWLVSMRPSLENNSFLNKHFENQNKTLSSNISDLSLPNAESTPKVDRKFSSQSTATNDDDIKVLDDDEERGEWSLKELENDTNIIIVENPDNNETLFVYVREEDGIVFEKCCVSGKILRTHDLKVLTNVEIINDLVLKLCFDSRVDSKREVKYQFKDIDSCLGFNDKFIIPWISERKQLVSEKLLYECLKCGQNRMSSYEVSRCLFCGSDSLMKGDNTRKRRSGSDITVLCQMNGQNDNELQMNDFEDSNVWEELFSINSCYDNSFFTRVEHSLKLYIEVKLFTNSSDEEEVVEGLVKCRAMSGNQNRLESAFLVVSNKNILILTVDENQNYDNFDAYLKLNICKPIESLIQFKEFPNLLSNQGFWLEFRDEDKQNETKSRSKSLINRFGSKRSRYSESNSSYHLIVFYDEIIGKCFINYFNETIDKLIKIPNSLTKNQRILIEENSIAINDDIVVMNVIKGANYKRNDMKNELILYENNALIVTEELVILGEICFEANNDYKIKVLFKDLIMNLMQEISVNLHSKSFRLMFSDDNIETHFDITLYTSDSIKKLLIPIRSQWEKAFEVPMLLKKC